MEPSIVDRDAFSVMGMVTRVAPENEKNENYALIWSKFESCHEQIKIHSTDKCYYGVSIATDEEGVMDYLAGMAVGNMASVPEGLVLRELPAACYAVFECTVRTIGETYVYAFKEWLPASHFEFSGLAPVFEQYPPEGDGESPVLIHIPVKAKMVQ